MTTQESLANKCHLVMGSKIKLADVTRPVFAVQAKRGGLNSGAGFRLGINSCLNGKNCCVGVGNFIAGLLYACCV